MRTITVREFAGLLQSLPPQLNEAAIRGLRSAAARGVDKIVQEIDHAEPYPAVDTGATRQAVITEPLLDGAELSVNTPQAAWMEFGTRPHMPPFGAILTWVTRKFQLGGTSKKARKARAQGAKQTKAKKEGGGNPRAIKHGPRMSKGAKAASDTAKAYAIAKKIQWKIAHYGTAPRGFFAKSMLVIQSKYAPQEVRHELKLLEKRL